MKEKFRIKENKNIYNKKMKNSKFKRLKSKAFLKNNLKIYKFILQIIVFYNLNFLYNKHKR
jgi:hypothetical protein